MKVSVLIELLEKMKDSKGDCNVCITVNGSYQRFGIETVKDGHIMHPGRIVIDVDQENYRF